MRKVFRALLGLAACAVFAYSLWQMGGYLLETAASRRLNGGLADGAVTVHAGQKDTPSVTEAPEGPEAFRRICLEEAPITVDFAALKEKCPDIVGWLYCSDSPINLPVVQGEDNDYYLRRLIDGSGNNSGTVFADYRNAPDFSDRNTILYGHNMKNRSMFGSLSDYRNQGYYDAHPVMWFLTPEKAYKLELVAGFVTPSNGDIYSVLQSDEEAYALMQEAVAASTFATELELVPGDRYLMLSTCSYEFRNARYVLAGRLAELVQ